MYLALLLTVVVLLLGPCVMPICAVPPPLNGTIEGKAYGEEGLTYNASAYDPRRTCYRGYTYFYPQGCSSNTVYRLYLCGSGLRLMFVPISGCYQIDLVDYGDFSLMGISGGFITRCKSGYCPTKKARKAVRAVANYDSHFYIRNGRYSEYLYLSDALCAPSWFASPFYMGRALVFSAYSDCYN